MEHKKIAKNLFGSDHLAIGGGKAAAMAIVASDHQSHFWRILPGHVPSVALPIPAHGVDREASFSTSARKRCEWKKENPV